MKRIKISSLISIFILATLLSSCNRTLESNKVEPTASPTTPVDSSITSETPEESNISALELVRLMGNGINLGNTMEAYGHQSIGPKAAVSTYETLWGQPITTKEMIYGMKTAGFDTLRIPVAWTNAMDFESGDYTIGSAYLDRVEEIVNYALDSDMYVIVNDHWDGGWWGMFGSATEDTRKAAFDLYIAMWTQIGERFKDYSDHLIFESANEELGNRLNDVTVALDSGTLSENECYELTNKINQTFVDTIRSTGGKNTQRFLLIAGYNTDIDMTCDDRFKMPSDAATDKLLLSVHYYTPWSYCGTDSIARWGTERHYKEQNDYLAKLKKFTDKGYGIVIGEWGVLLNAKGEVKNNTVDFFNNFLNNCDLYNICPVLWETNSLYKKDQLKIFDPDIAALFQNRSFAAQSALSEYDVKANAQNAMNAALEYAILNNSDLNQQVLNAEDKAIAWIMYNSNDYLVTYSVGDTYDPYSKTEGVVATDVEITGPGTYTVGLDLTGTYNGFGNSMVFSAVGILNGELLFPGYIINITDVKVNGKSLHIFGVPYTTSDDGRCTRVNLINEWVRDIPPEARTSSGNTTGLSAVILRGIGSVETMTVTFDYTPAE